MVATRCFFTWLDDGFAGQPDKGATANQREQVDCSTAETQCFFSQLVYGFASTCNSKSAGAGTLLDGGDTMLLLLAC
jgi:hypothetical protein